MWRKPCVCAIPGGCRARRRLTSYEVLPIPAEETRFRQAISMSLGQPLPFVRLLETQDENLVAGIVHNASKWSCSFSDQDDQNEQELTTDAES